MLILYKRCSIMGNTEKHKNNSEEDYEDVCTCAECGRDLYDSNNIMLEIKSAMDAHLDNTDPSVVGRPLYVIVIGDEGYELSASPINYIEGKDNNKLMISTLKDMIKFLKRDNKSRK